MLFDLIQKSLPPNKALVDEVSDILGVGTDATYRRMRGEKPISLEEAMKLCKNYHISMESLADIVIYDHAVKVHNSARKRIKAFGDKCFAIKG